MFFIGSRAYEPEIIRWHSVDPLAEKYYSWSPYNYVYNNPLNMFDPNGMEGFQISFDAVFSGHLFNAKGSIGIAYDYQAIHIIGAIGFGGTTQTKGVGFACGPSVGYFSGDINKVSGNYYVEGFVAHGFGMMAMGSIPSDDINKVKALLPTTYEVKQMNPEGSVSVVFGEGAAVVGGVEISGSLLKIGDTAKESVNLGNQTGQAPADASNVNNVYKNTVQYQLLGIDPSKSPAAMYESITGKKTTD